MTALLLAAQKKHAGIIKMLLDKADIWYQGGDNQNTALHIAVKEGDMPSIETILEFC